MAMTSKEKALVSFLSLPKKTLVSCSLYPPFVLISQRGVLGSFRATGHVPDLYKPMSSEVVLTVWDLLFRSSWLVSQTQCYR